MNWALAGTSAAGNITHPLNTTRRFYSLIMPTQNLTITSVNVSDITELSLPQGVYSNTELTEDTINLWSTVQLLLKYTQNLQELIDDLTKRTDAVEATLDNIIEAITKINQALADIINVITPKPSPWGVAGGILNFLSTAVGMFFPIVGTAIGVLGQLVIGIEQIVDGDISNGIFELTVGAFAAGLGLYKFGKRLKEKYKRTNNTVTDFDIQGKMRVGTYVKNTSILPNQGYRDNPPSYDTIYPDTTSRVSPVSSKVKTASIETSVDDLNRKVVDNRSTVMDTYQANNFTEFDWMSSIMSGGLLGSGETSNVVIETSRHTQYLGEPPFTKLVEENDVYFNGVIDNIGVRVVITDADFQEYFAGWPSGGTVMMSQLRDSYCDIGVPQSSLPIDRDIILPFLMSHGGEDSREVMPLLRYKERSPFVSTKRWSMRIATPLKSVDILEQPLLYTTNPSIPYIMLGTSNKDAPAARDAVDRMIDFWQDNNLEEVLTDIPDEP
jgi:tetrahydromethanopterin S-methyltransferase subunit B